MKKCFFALVLPLALLLTACGREPRPAALLLGQAADLNESETLLVIDGQNIPAWEYLYWLAAGEPVDWTAPLSEGGTLEDLVKADALADTALYAAVGTWAAAYGCTLTDAERNALPERHYAYLPLEQGRHLTETGVQYAKLYALYETPGSALAPAENELALFEQQTAPLTAERLLIPFESDREAARQKAAELFAHLNTAADPSAAANLPGNEYPARFPQYHPPVLLFFFFRSHCLQSPKAAKIFPTRYTISVQERMATVLPTALPPTVRPATKADIASVTS